MAIRLSDAAAALTIGDTGLRGAINLCKIIFYTGAQPSSANDSIGSAQPIITFFAAGGLSFATPVDGSALSPSEDIYYISKDSGQTWNGNNGFNESSAVHSGITNGQTYSAGWGRAIISTGDTGNDATSGTGGYVRVDFSVGSANSDCVMVPSPSFLVNTTSGQEIESIISSFMLKINKNMN